MEKDVGWFQVSMQDIFVVECLKCIFKLSKYLNCFLFREAIPGLDVFCQCSAVAIFINKIIIVGCSQHFNKFDDINVVHLGEDGNFVISELTEFGGVFEFLYIHDLDCVHLFVLFIFGFVDVAVLSLSYFFLQYIILDDFIHSSKLF